MTNILYAYRDIDKDREREKMYVNINFKLKTKYRGSRDLVFLNQNTEINEKWMILFQGNNEILTFLTHNSLILSITKIHFK